MGTLGLVAVGGMDLVGVSRSVSVPVRLGTGGTVMVARGVREGSVNVGEEVMFEGVAWRVWLGRLNNVAEWDLVTCGVDVAVACRV